MAARRITPSALPSTPVTGAVGGIHDSFINPPKAPKPDTSFAQGLLSLSKGLAQIHFQNEEQRAKEDLVEWTDATKELIASLSLDELEKELLNEEGTSIIEGLSPGRARYLHKMAGKRYANLAGDENGGLYDPRFQAELLNPESTFPNITARVEDEARTLLKFNDTHSAAFRASAQEEMGTIVNQVVASVKQQRGAATIKQNRADGVAGAAVSLDAFANNNHPDAPTDYTPGEWAKQYTEKTGGDIGDVLVSGLVDNVKIDLSTLTKETNIAALETQLGAVRAYLNKNDIPRDRYDVILRGLEKQIDEAQSAQEDMNEGESDKEYNAGRRRFTTLMSQFYTEVASQNPELFMGMPQATYNEQFLGWAASKGEDFADAPELLSKHQLIVDTFKDSLMRDLSENPYDVKAAEDAEANFLSYMFSNPGATDSEIENAFHTLLLNPDISLTGAAKVRLNNEVQKFLNRDKSFIAAISLPITRRSAEHFTSAMTPLLEELAEAEFGQDLDTLRDDEGPGGNAEKFVTWERDATDAVTAIFVGKLNHAINNADIENGNWDDAFNKVPKTLVDSMFDQAVAEYRQETGTTNRAATARAEKTNLENQATARGVAADDLKTLIDEKKTIPMASFITASGRRDLSTVEVYDSFSKLRALWDDPSATPEDNAPRHAELGKVMDLYTADLINGTSGGSLSTYGEMSRSGKVMFNGVPSEKHTVMWRSLRKIGANGQVYTLEELGLKERPADSFAHTVPGRRSRWRQRLGDGPHLDMKDDYGVHIFSKAGNTFGTAFGSNIADEDRDIFNVTTTLFARDESHLTQLAQSGDWKLVYDAHEELIGTPVSDAGLPLTLTNYQAATLEDLQLKWFMDNQTRQQLFLGITTTKAK